MEDKHETHTKRLVFVLDRFNAIEVNLAELIATEIGAAKEKSSFIRDVLLNNSMLPFSSKVKLFLHLRALNNWPPIDTNRLHRLMHIRNQFAHCTPKHHIHVNVDDKNDKVDVTEFLMLESVANTGKIEPTDSDLAFEQFKECYAYIRAYLLALDEKPAA